MKFTHLRPKLYAFSAVLIATLMMLSAGSASAAALQQSDVILEDDFSDNSNKWNTGFTEKTESIIEDGKLKIKIQRPDDGANTFKSFTPPVSAEDVDISVDAVFSKGAPENTAFGFDCRYKDGENRISLVIKPSGIFTIQKMVGGKWTVLIPWSNSGLINRKTSVTNNIRLVCGGGHVTLYINKGLAADVVDTDKSLAGGSFRLKAGSYGSNKEDKNPVEMSFDNLVVRKPQAWKDPSGVLFSEKFNEANDNWILVPKSDWGYSDQITGGQMVMNFEKPNAWKFKFTPIQLANVDMSFDTILKKGALNDASTGALCRVTDGDNYYDFAIRFDADGTTGYYYLGKKINGTYETLIDWTESSAITVGIGKTNRMRVVCSGSDLELYVNGKSLFKTKDTSLTLGGSAFIVNRYAEDDTPVSVAFDNLEETYP